MSLKLAAKNREASPEAYRIAYGEAVEARIRKRYSVGQELAMLRQRVEKPEEFAAYFAYAEECKASVKAEVSNG